MAWHEQIREQFPALSLKIRNYPLVYLDNGATTQKPLRVIERLDRYYRKENSNIHRGVHSLSLQATALFEQARESAAQFFQVKDPQQVIFTSGTTDSINLIALGLAKKHLRKGDEILVSAYEHHSNILPWQRWAQENGGKLKVIGLKEDHSLDYESLEAQINERTRLISISQVSNSLGLIADMKRISGIAKKRGIPLLVDGAQSAPRMPVDLSEMDPDFFACSAHKMYGPTGVGILYLSKRWLNELPAVKTGGGTIKTVSFEQTEYVSGALRFEPGTPDIAGVIAFAEAMAFMNECGMKNIEEHEKKLTRYADDLLRKIPGVDVYGQPKNKTGVISFNVSGVHPMDAGILLDQYGIAVRTGHHCTQPLMQCLGVEGTVRISFGAYNTVGEVDFFVEKLEKCIAMLKQEKYEEHS
jgi:cysteine desulfurase/selenocysteine lyase